VSETDRRLVVWLVVGAAGCAIVLSHFLVGWPS
jgi:hypothetical protein